MFMKNIKIFTKNNQNVHSLLGVNLLAEGNLKVQGSLQVDGYIKGHIVAEGDIIINQSGEVHGLVEADNVYIAGLVDGNARAINKLKIKSSGILTGDANTKKIKIETGGAFYGKCNFD